MRHFLFSLGMTLAAGMPPAGAFAHALLSQAVPPVGGIALASPKEIRLTFSEAVEPHFSGIELSAADGRPIITGPASIDPADAKQLVLPAPPLAPGTYRVRWHVVSVDSHRTEGDFTFTVGP